MQIAPHDHHHHIEGNGEQVREYLRARERVCVAEIPAGLSEPVFEAVATACVGIMERLGHTRFWMVMQCAPGMWAAILVDTEKDVGIPFRPTGEAS